MSDTPPFSKRYLRKGQVQERYGRCSAMWIKRHIAADGFPEPAMYTGQSPLWSLDDLDTWMMSNVRREIAAGRVRETVGDNGEPVTLH